MEIEVFGNKLKLENNEIYNYRKINQYSNKEWHKITFTLSNFGYLTCLLRNNKVRRTFFKHRLIYLFYNLDFDILNSKIILDHVDRNRLNNSIDNLRVVTTQENAFNRGAKGFYFHKPSCKWVAQITLNGKGQHIGCYDTEEEAHEAYLQAKKKYHIISLK